MERDGFWLLVDRARDRSGPQPTGEEVARSLAAILVQLDPDELIDFDRITTDLLTESYTWPLWGAAYTMCGGCSDDGFDYFRGWLILQGQPVFEAALANPDSLADIDLGEDDFPECEELWYLAENAYKDKTGNEMPDHPLDYSDLGDAEWDFDDAEETMARLPRLWARYGEDPL